MTAPLNFQEIVMKLHAFWLAQNCVLWQPYNVQVGAGTANPATLLRVLGPEPWRTAYVEPSVRPDDGRYGENPNRMQYYYQYQVILKPDPGNPQELYLQSLEAIGINPREHDIRFVEDNWESPALGAWGLGWEVWLDGQEITQFTYFQQAGGIELNPVSVEITYGLERIALPLQGKDSVWKLDWLGGQNGGLLYGDVLFRSEVEHCKYYFEVADVDGLKATYDIYERESKRALEAGLVVPAYDYVLKCSHLFNVLDARGAIGVTERASFFRRMRDMTRKVARAYADQREQMQHPMSKLEGLWGAPSPAPAPAEATAFPAGHADVLIEIGVEELPAGDVDAALFQLGENAPELFAGLRLTHEGVSVFATPRRLVVHAKNVAPVQPDRELTAKGPSAGRAYDASGVPTKAAEGFARGKGVAVTDLKIETIDGSQYVVAHLFEEGRPAAQVLAEALPAFIASFKFGKSMRWNQSGVAFSRPIRWLVALIGEAVIPFEVAGLASGRVTRGLRPFGSPEFLLNTSAEYPEVLGKQGIVLSLAARKARIHAQVALLAAQAGGRVLEDPALLDEVANLVEAPTALLGKFDPRYLGLPREVLVTVMRKKQRYFAVEDAQGNLLPYFITVRNGDGQHLHLVAEGNEQVLRARFADAEYFFSQDTQKTLRDFLPRLNTLTFQEKLGSMFDKNQRVGRLVEPLGKLLGTGVGPTATAQEAAAVLKADLATQMVVEMTSLQGAMGREYALRSGFDRAVADAIYEHWLPRSADDGLPASDAGLLLAVADRLDSLVGLFAVGLAPQSTADPYGLRRAALGIIQILIQKDISVDLEAAVALAAGVQPVPVSAEVQNQVIEFIGGRLRSWLDDQAFPADVLTAVLAAQSANPARALAGVRQLTDWVSRPGWQPLLEAFARCVRITRSESALYSLDAAAFHEPEEVRLFESFQLAAAQLTNESNVDAFLTAFAPMQPAIATFFEKVLVNAPDTTVRANRLGLLQAISALQTGRADLSFLNGF